MIQIDFVEIYSLNRELFHKQEATASQPPLPVGQSRIPTASSNARSRAPVNRLQRNNSGYSDRKTIAPSKDSVVSNGCVYFILSLSLHVHVCSSVVMVTTMLWLTIIIGANA